MIRDVLLHVSRSYTPYVTSRQGQGAGTAAAGALNNNILINTMNQLDTYGTIVSGSVGNNNAGLFIKSNNSLWAFGQQANQELGVGDSVTRSSPVQVGTLTNWKSVSVGYSHTIAVKTDGTLWNWGNSSSLASIPIMPRSSPIQVGADTNWAWVSAGDRYSMAIKTDGTLWGMGNNVSGSLGNEESAYAFGKVKYGNNYVSASAGDSHTMAIKSDGTLWGFGADPNGQLGQANTSGFFSKVQMPYGTVVTASVNNNNSNPFTLLINSDGTLWGFGTNGSYQLGDGTIVNKSLPVQITDSNNWRDVSAGGTNGLGIKSDGTLWGWGQQSGGQLGDGTTTTRSLPVQIPGTSNWSKVSAGTSFTIAIRTDGTLWGWGANASGAIGDNTAVNKSSPVQIGTLTNWSSVSSGNSYTMAVKTDGTLWGWGSNGNGQLGDSSTTTRSSPVQIGTLSDWSSVYSNASHTMAVKTDGTLWGWGSNGFGQVGDTTSVNKSSPVQIGTDTNWSKAISRSWSYTMAVKTNGTLWGWGSDQVYAFGTGTSVVRSSPVQLGTLTNWTNVFGNTLLSAPLSSTGLYASSNTTTLIGYKTSALNVNSPTQVGDNTNWSSVSANFLSSMATKTDGTLWGWGYNSIGNLGTGVAGAPYSSPVQIGTLTNWKSVSIGLSHTMAIKTDGTLWGWASGGLGQLGNGKTQGAVVKIDNQIANPSKLASGTSHTIFVTTGGGLWAWGTNTSGQLGDSSTTTRSSPVQIGTLTDWTSVAAGQVTSHAVKTDGTLWGWGYNGFGNVGDGNTVQKSSPVQIGTLTNWSKVSTNVNNSLAIKTDGTLWAWGFNGSGYPLGLNDTQNRSSPTQVGVGNTWSSVSAGLSHGMAIKSDGTLWGWGQQNTGQIGDNSTSTRFSPIQIGTLTNWASVSGGQSHTMAIKSDGTLWGWGSNTSGQIGDNSATTKSSPVQIGTETNWSKVVAGTNVTHAIKTDGTLWAWGDGSTYTLGAGLGIQTNKSSPVQIGTSTNWTDVSNVQTHITAINNSELYEFGSNVTGWSFNTYSPVQIGTLTNWSSVDAGYNYNSAIKADGTLWTWGSNARGQLGDGTTVAKDSPVQIGTQTNWSKVLTTKGIVFETTIGLKTDGTLWGWGYNAEGGIGDGTGTNRSSPVQIGTLTNWYNIGAGANGWFFSTKTDGTLWGWGVNSLGTIGDNTAVSKSSPVQIGGATNWSNAFGGYSHTVAIKTNGELYSTGANNNSVLLLGRITTIADSPVQVGTDTNWAKVYAGQWDTFGIRNDGTLWAWGKNSNGKLGLGDTTLRNSPVQVGTNTWTKIRNSDNHTIGLRTDGSIYVWGSDGQAGTGGLMGRGYDLTSYNLLDDPTWAYVSAGTSTTMAIKPNGTLWGWGLGTTGQIGDGTTISRSSPVQIGTLTNWSSVVASPTDSHTMAIKTDGTLWCWGNNNYGQLGDNTTVNRSSPVQIGTLTNWSSVTGYTSFTMAIKTDGTLWGWGRNNGAYLGDGTLTTRSSPVQIGTLTDWSKVSTSKDTGLAVKTDGTLWTWGDGTYGGMANNTLNMYSSPIQIGTQTDWSNVFGGYISYFATKTNGTLWAWGWNEKSQLGVGQHPNALGLTEGTVSVSQISTADGGSTSHYIKTDGTLWGWGTSGNGELGDGTTITRSSPVQIGADADWSKISGNFTTFAIKTNGTLWGWGYNGFGQIGDNTAASKSSPVQIGTDYDWSDVITSGNNMTLAVKTTGTLWAWGWGTNGQLGLGDTVSRSSPVQIGTLSTWSKIANQGGTCHAIKTDGTLWGWGSGNQATIGDGVVVSRSSPVQIGTLTNWSNVWGGGIVTLATKTDGTLWGWGNNNFYGHIGDATVTSRSSPVQIGNDTNWSIALPTTSFTIAIKTNGTMWSWGHYSGLLDGTSSNRSSPVQVGSISNWSKLAVTVQVGAPILATNTSNELWSANSTSLWPLLRTINRSSPVQVGTLTNWSGVANAYSTAGNGSNTTIAYKTDGTLWGWGENGNYRLGFGSSDTSYRSSPVQLSGVSNVNQISLAPTHALVKDTSNNVYYSGTVDFPNIRGNVTPKSSPVQITAGTWSDILTTGFHSMAVKSDGTLWGWGYNPNGQLGLNDTTNRSAVTQVGTKTNWNRIEGGLATSVGFDSSKNMFATNYGYDFRTVTPIAVSTATNWSVFSAGFSFTMGIKQDGTLWGMGNNVGGQLGDRSVISRSSPVQVGTLTNWAKVSAGKSHTIAIKTDGTLWSWGYGDYGQLGTNQNFVSRSSPVQIGTDTNWSNIWTNWDTVHVIKTDGTLWGWGNNSQGTIGDNTAVNKSSPVQIGTQTNWSFVTNQASYTMAVKTDGTLWGWGYNQFGNIGDNTVTTRSSPVQIGTLTNWSSVALHTNLATAAVKTDGTLWNWGNGGSLGHAKISTASRTLSKLSEKNWSNVSVADTHVLAVGTDGTLWAWGTNSVGYIGDNTTGTTRSAPVQIGSLSTWTYVAAGSSVSAGILSDGTLWTWGSGTNGRLGLNSTVNRSSPVQVGTLSDWAKISMSPYDTIATKTDGTLWGWGYNFYGGLGDGTAIARSSPVQIGTLTGWSEIIAGVYYSMATKTDGTLWAWGLNTSGQLGQNDTVTARSSPVQIGTLTNWSKVGAGTYNSFAIKTDGTLWGWGYADSGRLGLTNSKLTLNKVDVWKSTQSYEAGENHFATVLSNGTLWAWGLNQYGAIGNNSTANRSFPVRIGNEANWSKVAAGQSHTLAIKTDGTLWGWGINSAGELGDNSTSTTSSPVQIGTLTNWASVSGGSSYTMAIKTDGTLWGWGYNGTGNIGDSTTITRSSPVQIGTDTNWSSVSSNGYIATSAIKTDGTLWSWGWNNFGELGDNTTVNKSSPVQIGTLTNWASVAAGYGFKLSVKTDGTLWSWGYNANGGLGDGTTINRSSPVQIGTLTNWSKVYASVDASSGRTSAWAIKTDGTLWGWGSNGNYQLTDGTTTNRSSPVQIGTLTNWSNAKGGTIVSVALDTNGYLHSGGSVSNGTLGRDEGLNPRSSPVQIGAVETWSSVSAAVSNQVHAIRTNGTLWAWGINSGGTYGDGTTTTASAPTQVGSLTTWAKVADGASNAMVIDSTYKMYSTGINNGNLGYFIYAGSNLSSPIQVGAETGWSSISAWDSFNVIKTNGTLWAWGTNTDGQLGDGTVVSKSSPVQVGSLTFWKSVSTGQSTKVGIIEY